MTIFTGGPRTAATSFLEEYSVSTGAVIGAFAEDAIKFSPTNSILRAQEQKDAQDGDLSSGGVLGAIMDPLAGEQREKPKTEIITLDEQKERIEEAGVVLKPVEGMRSGTLDILIERKKEEVENKSVISRASGWQVAGGFGAGVVASLFDPLNVASAFIPVVGPARYAGALARQTSRTGKALVRARMGAVEGAVGAAVVEPIVALQARNEQADYKMADSLLNITFGTVLGGGLHSGFGAVGDALKARKSRVDAVGREAEEMEQLSAEMRDEMFKANLALLVEDRGPVGPGAFRANLEGSTAIGQTQDTTPRIKVTQDKIEVDGVAVASDVQAEARVAEPQLFDEVDRIELEQKSVRAQLDTLAAGREEAKVTQQIDQKIAELEAGKEGLNKRKTKKLQKRIDELNDERVALESNFKSTDTPEMGRLRARLMELDNARRDRAVDVANVLSAVEERLGKGTPIEKTVFRADQGAELKDRVEFSRSPQNLRLVNFEALDRHIEEFAGQPDTFDLNVAKAETDEIMQEIDSFTQQVGDESLANTVKRIVEAETDNVTLAEAHSDAVLAAFTCRTR